MTCEDCQFACYDLLDRSLCAKDEQEVLAHIENCPQCRSFLEAEGFRMRTWPRLLGMVSRNSFVPSDVVERVSHALEVSHKSGTRQPHAEGRGRLFRRWLNVTALAASLLILAGIGVAVRQGTDMWTGADRAQAREGKVDQPVAPVMLIGQSGVKGLDLPESLPGMLRLSSGEVVVRLNSGVELTVIGPIVLEVQDCMRVQLEQGRLLANVPHWATGFTVRTDTLEIFDLGTVFSVSARQGSLQDAVESVTDVFVFKGSVQVNEAGYRDWNRTISGAGVGICEAGEGVRAVCGESPAKIEADWADAKNMFREVRAERALQNPEKALATAKQIVDLWAERNMPGSNLVVNKVLESQEF